MKTLVIAIALLAAGRMSDQSSESKPVTTPPSYFVYWLSGPEPETRQEYLTILVTPWPIEKLAGHKRKSEVLFDNTAMTFRTHRRDSLWDNPFKPVKACTTVDTTEKPWCWTTSHLPMSPANYQTWCAFCKSPWARSPSTVARLRWRESSKPPRHFGSCWRTS